MGTFLSLCYTAVDTICLILFLDVFEQRRFDGLKFHLHVLEYVLLSCWVPLILSIIVGHNQALKILIILLIDFIIAKRLYTEISTAILCFFVTILALSPKQAKRCYDYFYCGISMPSIAEKEGTTVGSVSGSIKSALINLREKCNLFIKP